jgi:DNA-binding beta-propeller fold protein YncE
MFHAEPQSRRDWTAIILGVSAPLRETYLVVLTIALVFAATAVAEESTIATLLSGLQNPCGVAVRSGGTAAHCDVFVADSGSGRIVKMASDKPDVMQDAITGFSTTGSGSGPLETSGPRGLLFLGLRHLLVVCGGGDEPESVRLYELPEDGSPLKAADARRVMVLSAPSDGAAGANRLYAVARTQINESVADLIVVTALGNRSQGWLGKAPVRAGALGELTPFVAAAQTSDVLSPAGIAVGEKGYVVVGQKAAADQPAGAVLVFYDPIDGSPLMTLATELHTISGLAYSRVTGNLYATDLAAESAREGGVFRIDDASRPGAATCEAVRLATVERPTALAFGPDGALYVTACGRTTGRGLLVRLTSKAGAL